MPVLLVVLSIVGTAAMIWVGGGIIVHGLEEFGWPWAGHVIHAAAEAAARGMPAITGAVEWIVTAAGSGVVGLVVGGALIPIVGYVLAPAWKAVRRPLAKTHA
jgi:predicted DNA repair protein MutK